MGHWAARQLLVRFARRPGASRQISAFLVTSSEEQLAAVSNQAQIAFRGNRYSLVPGHAGEVVTVRHKLGATTVDVIDRHGGLLAHHVRQPDGAGAVIRLDEHVSALSKLVLANFSDREPCRRKTRRPPSAAALAEAERIRDRAGLGEGEHVVVDFADYVEQTRAFGGDDDHDDDQAGQR